MANYYDAVDRFTDVVSVGTNGGSSYTRPSTPPSRSDTALVKSYAYNAAGWVESVTDARAIVGKSYYDNLGQTTKTIEAYVNGTQSDGDDKTTEFGYDGGGHMVTLKAYLTSSTYQKTEWVYGVTTGSAASDVDSNDILAAMKYPDKSSGDPSNSEKESFTVNALGERKTKTDRNGSVHTFSYDVVGRMTADAVTTLGSGVDGSIRRLETAYDTAGLAYLFTSYDAASSGNVVNQAQRAYNGLRQIITEYQAHGGAVNTSTTPKVQYAFSEMSSGANHSRLTSMTYPNSRALTFTYASGLDSTISRLSSIVDGSTTLEAYTYLGLGTVVKRAHGEPGVDLTYIKQSGESNGEAGDQYAGLDRFGRVVDQRWIKTSDSSHTDRFNYDYDRDSSRLFRKNLVDAAFSELYHANGSSEGYDLLSQLTAFRRGTLSDSNSDSVPDTVTTASRSQVWDFDALGNWDTLTTDSTDKDRTHNKQNQITSIESQTTPAYDGNGNMTTDENNKTLVYDAWNHLVQYRNGNTVLVSYGHDALGRRITRTESSTTTDLYYTAAWQVLEERVSGTARVQYVWSPVYVDALVERDRDTDSNGSLEERLYVQQDANWNVTALISTSGTVLERYVYDPYGQATVLTASWGSTSGTSYAWVYLHQGGRFESVTGLYYFRNRENSPTQGRWAQRDPIEFGAGDVNLYRIVSDNPSTRMDPFGLLADPAAVITVVGTVTGTGGGTVITTTGTGTVVTTVTGVGGTGVVTVTGTGTGIATGTVGIGTAAGVGVVGGVVAVGGYYTGTVLADYTTVPLADALFRWWYRDELARIRRPLPVRRPCPKDRDPGPKEPCDSEWMTGLFKCADKYLIPPIDPSGFQKCIEEELSYYEQCLADNGFPPGRPPLPPDFDTWPFPR